MLKLVRDDFETKIPELEANLSSVLGQPWKISFDPGHLYTFANDRWSKEEPGQMFTQYIPLSLLPILTLHPTQANIASTLKDTVNKPLEASQTIFNSTAPMENPKLIPLPPPTP